ncbi:DUF1295 domain-containing protein [Salinispira pacifica]
MIYGNAGSSLPQRILVQLLETVLLAVGVFLLFRTELDPGRRWLLAAAFVVVYLRITVTMFHLLRRSMGWEEAISIPFAFAAYYIGFALLAGGGHRPVVALEIAGALLFAAGSLINTLSELLRDRWKRDPSHNGKLYTEGLFRYSMHVNYFGDLLWVLGLALITANPWSLLIPAALFCFFAFYNAPMLDRHLEQKYGDQFREYAARTRKIIPFVY